MSDLRFAAPLEHCDVEGLLRAAAELIADHTGEFAVTGTLTSFSSNGRWPRAELVTYRGQRSRCPAARIRVVVRPGTRLPDEELEGANVLVQGRLAVHHLCGPLHLEAVAITVVRADSPAARATAQLAASITNEGRHLVNKRLRLADEAMSLAVVCPFGGESFAARLCASGLGWDYVTVEVDMSSPAHVADAIAFAAHFGVDAVVVCRGGGHASDLAVFDSGEVVDAIVACPLPVVTAIGCSNDHHLADLVAHTSLPSPSDAAAWFNDRRS